MNIIKVTNNLRLSSKWQMEESDEWIYIREMRRWRVFYEIIAIHVGTKNEVSCESKW